LAVAPLGGLRELALSSNVLGEAAFAALASAGWLAGLDTLRLSGTGMTRRGLRHLLGAAQLPRPRYLDLGENRFGDAGVEDLARSPLPERVHILSLSRSGLTDRAARALVATPYLTDATYLSLSGNQFSPVAKKALKGRFRDAYNP
jgi:hypothetical protein